MVDGVGRMVLGYSVVGDCVGLCGFEGDVMAGLRTQGIHFL